MLGISDEELFMDSKSEHIIKKSLDSPSTLFKLIKSVSMYKKGVHNFIRMLNLRIEKITKFLSEHPKDVSDQQLLHQIQNRVLKNKKGEYN